MKSANRFLALALVSAVMIASLVSRPAAGPVSSYTVANLVADTGGAVHKDKLMVNAWGIASLGGNDPFWINDEGSGVSELIDGKGKISAGLRSVTIPALAGALGASRPTGIVANTTDQFSLPNGSPALFIFDTIDGTVAGWNATMGRNAAIVVNNSSKAVYTGLAIATKGGSPFLYAANSNGTVDVFDGGFKPVKTTGGFADPHLSTGLTPYGIATIANNVFVAYAARHFQSGGAVDEFDSDGNLIMQFTSAKLNAPWAVVTAPQNFGAFSNDLLVGNFGDGRIIAFNPTNGEFLGQLMRPNGQPIQISGLWALMVGEGVSGVTNPNALYFTAGPNGQLDGLFGFIAVSTAKPKPTKRPTPTPKPKKQHKPTPTPTASYHY